MFGITRKSKDQTSVHKQAEVNKQIRLIGSMRKRANHILFEVDVKNRVIRRAEYNSSTLSYLKAMKKDYSVRRELTVTEGCFYEAALNIPNLLKRLKRSGINADDYLVEK